MTTIRVPGYPDCAGSLLKIILYMFTDTKAQPGIDMIIVNTIPTMVQGKGTAKITRA